MPIRSDLRSLYPVDWPTISHRIRFDRAGGRCETCGRRHGSFTYQLRSGIWRELGAPAEPWRDGRGAPVPAPVIRLGDRLRIVRIVLTCAHRNHWPPDVSDDNLAAWCCRCHLAHDRPHHAESRRSRLALGDLFAASIDPAPSPPLSN